MKTRILKIHNPQALGHFAKGADGSDSLEHWEVAEPRQQQQQQGEGEDEEQELLLRSDMAALSEAAAHLRSSDTPVGFPTETVYGLGADATRSGAVRGIYKAKGRPSDNPLIVHVCDLAMLRRLLAPASTASTSTSAAKLPSKEVNGVAVTAAAGNGEKAAEEKDVIPAIYRPLIERFWPGPLTILLPNPPNSSLLAPEVTAGLPTFGARMPASPLARSLIALAGAPLAAPSANASTRPSPTTAAHVRDDLAGKVALVLDGGSCRVGVESTVVDGLCEPPVVLRPGGVSVAELRACPGWERVGRAYRDRAEEGTKGEAPRAPGMKYKHYSPRARVVLYEAGRGAKEAASSDEGVAGDIISEVLLGSSSSSGDGGDETKAADNNNERRKKTVGLIRTGGSGWPPLAGLKGAKANGAAQRVAGAHVESVEHTNGSLNGDARNANGTTDTDTDPSYTYELRQADLEEGEEQEQEQEQASTAPAPAMTLLDINLGRDKRSVAQGLFAALRELDARGADVIFVEGIADDRGDDIAAAVMNRLRKAASEIRP